MFDQTTLNQPLWDFSVDLYDRNGVAAVCLALQDHCSVDVNVLLTVSWLASQKRLLSRELLAELELVSADWRRQCLQPLRAVRRYLKQQALSDALYQASKTLELNAERWQQDRLYRCCAPSLVNLKLGQGFDVYRKNLNLYWQSLPHDSDQLPLLSEAFIACLKEHLG